jgi:signal transduction histidine kinase
MKSKPGDSGERIRWELGERRKELTAVLSVARILHELSGSSEDCIERVLSVIPRAWQYPDVTVARIEVGDIAKETADFAASPWQQIEEFETRRGTQGRIIVGYTSPPTEGDDSPFLLEERDLIRCLAQMLRSHFDHLEADAELQRSNERLEEQVRDRTQRLSDLTSELTLSEERQRREFARELHDHLGQALAFLRMQLHDLQGDLVFTGHESRLESMNSLLEKAIRYTRTLTAEISPPVLYELGLLSALEWLCEQMEEKHGLHVRIRHPGRIDVADETVRVLLFIAIRELLFNIVKHADVDSAALDLQEDSERIHIVVRDEGRGFDPAAPNPSEHFGLFSVAERIRSIGGHIRVESQPGQGTRIEIDTPRRPRPHE